MHGGLVSYYQNSSGPSVFLSYDQSGNTRVATGTSQANTGTFDYQAFGPIFRSTLGAFYVNLYAGQYGYLFFNSAVPMYNTQARWYDPTSGTWLSRDPIDYDGGDWNLYRYVGNEPVGRVNPGGITPVPAFANSGSAYPPPDIPDPMQFGGCDTDFAGFKQLVTFYGPTGLFVQRLQLTFSVSCCAQNGPTVRPYSALPSGTVWYEAICMKTNSQVDQRALQFPVHGTSGNLVLQFKTAFIPSQALAEPPWSAGPFASDPEKTESAFSGGMSIAQSLPPTWDFRVRYTTKLGMTWSCCSNDPQVNYVRLMT